MKKLSLDDFARTLDGGTGRAMGVDGVVRFDVNKAAEEKMVDFVRRTNDAGGVCAAMIHAPGDKKLRVAVYPKGLELPKPIAAKSCEKIEDAQRGVEIGKEQFPMHYVRYFEVDKNGEYIRENSETPTDHYSVEVWEPWDFLRRGLYPCWTVRDIVDAHGVYGFKGADREMVLQERAEDMTARGRASCDQRREEQRAEYLKIRASHSGANKKWIQRTMALNHPRKKGWKFDTIQSNTIDLE